MSAEASRADDSQYYTTNRATFIADFGQTRKAVRDYVSSRSSAEIAEEICKEAAERFQELLPNLPYVGGDINPGTKFVLLACQWLTVFKSMEQRKYGAPEVGRMMLEIMEAELNRMPEEEVEMQRALTFDKHYIDLVKDWTSQTPIFKNDWIDDVVEGDG